MKKARKKALRSADTETAEGHRKSPLLDQGTEDGKRSTIKRSEALDDVAEGHRRTP